MAREGSIYFSVVELEAMVRALERCGINSGDSSKMLEYFGDPQIVQAAISVSRKCMSRADVITQTYGEGAPKNFGAVADLSDKLAKSNRQVDHWKSKTKDLVDDIESLSHCLEREHIELASRKIEDILKAWSAGEYHYVDEA